MRGNRLSEEEKERREKLSIIALEKRRGILDFTKESFRAHTFRSIKNLGKDYVDIVDRKARPRELSCAFSIALKTLKDDGRIVKFNTQQWMRVDI